MPSLILIKAPGLAGPGQTHKLAADEIILGRDNSCGIVVPNHAVSRQHARIIRTDSTFFIEDLNSRNKTFVNNRELGERHQLRHDDRIKICDFQFLYQDENTQTKPKLAIPDHLKKRVASDEETLDAAEVEAADMSSVETTIAANRGGDLLGVQPSDKLRVLLDISMHLSKSLEVETLLNSIADAALGVFRQADRCFIILAEDNDKLIPKVVRARRPTTDDHRFSKTIVRKCMSSATAYLSEDASSDAAMGAAQSIAEFRIRSVMCVPLTGSDGKAIGAMQLDTQDRTKKFREDDLRLLLIISNLAAVAIEKARLHESTMAREKQQKEIELAQTVQLGFLPKSVPNVPGYDFFHAYSAAQTVGGDYYDILILPDGRVAVLLGDVAGKGVPASLLMAKLSAEARFCMLTQSDPAAALTLLNDLLINGGIGDRFVTFAAVIIRPDTHQVTIVNAGHLNPIRFRLSDKRYEEAVTNDQSGLPLGLVEGYPYTAVDVTLEAGECFLLFTDGVTDAQSPAGVMFELDGVKNALVGDSPMPAMIRPKMVGERLFTTVRKHASGRPQPDDIAIVCVGRMPETAPLTTVPDVMNVSDSGPTTG